MATNEPEVPNINPSTKDTKSQETGPSPGAVGMDSSPLRKAIKCFVDRIEEEKSRYRVKDQK